MLVLTRKENERLLFPTLDVVIEVVRVQGNRTRLGIAAPADVPVVREEIADLKGVEFAPSETAANHKLSSLSKATREKISSSVEALHLLHQELDGNEPAQNLVMDVFRELKALDEEVSATMGDDDASQSPQVLFVDDGRDDHNLLASCLRLGGFEVSVAANVQDAIDYLSLHARPDFTLVTDERDAVALRGEAGNELRLIGWGVNDEGVDRCFPASMNGEELVEALAVEVGVSA